MSGWVECVRGWLSWIGDLGTLVTILIALCGIWMWFKGVFTPLRRLGLGLASRKIAVFAKGDRLVSLKRLLEDSQLINVRNIVDIPTPGDLGRCEQASVFLVDWSDWGDNIENILQKKRDSVALIVYAAPGAIPLTMMARLDETRHTIVANFRGRALNDVIIAMMSTAGAAI